MDHCWIIPIGDWVSLRLKKLIGTFLSALPEQREISLGQIYFFILVSGNNTVVHSYGRNVKK